MLLSLFNKPPDVFSLRKDKSRMERKEMFYRKSRAVLCTMDPGNRFSSLPFMCHSPLPNIPHLYVK